MSLKREISDLEDSKRQLEVLETELLNLQKESDSLKNRDTTNTREIQTLTAELADAENRAKLAVKQALAAEQRALEANQEGINADERVVEAEKRALTADTKAYDLQEQKCQAETKAREVEKRLCDLQAQFRAFFRKARRTRCSPQGDVYLDEVVYGGKPVEDQKVIDTLLSFAVSGKELKVDQGLMQGGDPLPGVTKTFTAVYAVGTKGPYKYINQKEGQYTRFER